jgi:hypothetical protein
MEAGKVGLRLSHNKAPRHRATPPGVVVKVKFCGAVEPLDPGAAAQLSHRRRPRRPRRFA